MRESRAPAPRPPRALVRINNPIVEAFDIADVLIVVDGQEVRLGEYWFIARCEAEGSRHG